MIQTQTDYLEYVEADRVAANWQPQFDFKEWLTNPVRRYVRLLRKREWLVNTKPKKGIWRFVRLWYGFWFRRLSTQLCLTIPENCFGPGLYITHGGPIVVNPKARIGKNCEINICVNIGHGYDCGGAPQIGDNCFIGPGAKIFGEIVIGDNVKIGANAVVNKSFPEGNCTLVGVPARSVNSHHRIEGQR